MTPKTHHYQIQIHWTGNRGVGTAGYRSYARDHEIAAPLKPVIAGSADAAFLGDPTRWNPEELFLAALAACHQLWYLHLTSDAGIRVLDYVDSPVGEMQEGPSGGGSFTQVTLKPRVTIAAGGDPALASALHEAAHRLCFIANSVRTRVLCDAIIHTETDDQ